MSPSLYSSQTNETSHTSGPIQEHPEPHAEILSFSPALPPSGISGRLGTATEVPSVLWCPGIETRTVMSGRLEGGVVTGAALFKWGGEADMGGKTKKGRREEEALAEDLADRPRRNRF